MSWLYLDTSIVVALLFEEKGHRIYRRKISQFDELLSSHLLEAEVCATAAREGVGLDKADEFIHAITLIMPDRSLKPEYQEILTYGYCRGADLYHLANLLFIDPEKKNVSFLSADSQQVNLARKIGLKIAI